MANRKFDKLIEYVVAGDEKKARSLFHEIVVEKSRKIYEAFDSDNTERAFDDVEADHTAADDELGGEEFGDEEIGGDEADDLQTDVFVDDELPSGEEESELNPEIDDRVADLESEFDALKAEFEELLHAEEHEGEEDLEAEGEEEEGLEGLEDAGEEAEGEEESLEDEVEEGEGAEGAEESEEEEREEEPVDESIIREYVLKVTKGLADATEEGSVQKKSTVAGKNEIVKGVNAKNLNQGGTSEGRPNPKSGEFTSDKIQNRPGGNAGVKSLKSAPKPVTTKEEGSVNTKAIES